MGKEIKKVPDSYGMKYLKEKFPEIVVKMNREIYEKCSIVH